MYTADQLVVPEPVGEGLGDLAAAVAARGSDLQEPEADHTYGET